MAMTELDGPLHVVFGATGAIGSAAVTELVHAGHDVRAVSRGGQAPDGGAKGTRTPGLLHAMNHPATPRPGQMPPDQAIR